MSAIALPQVPGVSVRGERFTLRRAEDAIETASGVTQITTYPDRRWTVRIEVVPRYTGTNQRLWALFAFQMTTLANWFEYGPPHYEGPSTGYAGPSPVVFGADQLGLTINVDGLSNSVPILKAGDFISFDTVSAGANTNRQLNCVTADVSSNGSGQATFTLLLPIRQAPADNAAVNITTPTAFFRLVAPENGIDMDVENFTPFSFDAIEREFP